jgi:hypothetical protein
VKREAEEDWEAMTTDPDELNYLRLMLVKKRKRNSHWVWSDRPVEERGIR